MMYKTKADICNAIKASEEKIVNDPVDEITRALVDHKGRGSLTLVWSSDGVPLYGKHRFINPKVLDKLATLGVIVGFGEKTARYTEEGKGFNKKSVINSYEQKITYTVHCGDCK